VVRGPEVGRTLARRSTTVMLAVQLACTERIPNGGTMNTNSPDASKVPPAIGAFQTAHDRRDIATALAQFADDAGVVDDGRTYDGIAGVESFLRTAASEYTFTRTLVDAVEIAPDHWIVTNHLEGDFPGGQVDLAYEFRLADGVITHLTIAP
jgi:ketosteroid isomerase-like protein